MSDNNSSNFNNENQHLQRINWENIKQPHVFIYLFLNALTCLIGTSGNTLTIMTFFLSKNLRDIKNVFIVNLAVADLIITSIVMPSSIIGVILGKEYFDDKYSFCAFLATSCISSCMSSMATVCCISSTRYFYICKYSWYLNHFTKRNVYIIIGIIWANGFLLHFPNYVGWGNVKYSFAFQTCTGDNETLSYSIMISTYMNCMIFLTFLFYYKIYSTLKSSSLAKKMVMKLRRADDHQSTTENPLNNEHSLKNEMKLIKTSFKIFLLFITTWLPVTCLLVLGVAGVLAPIPIYLYAYYLSHVNSVLNFFVYYVDNETFRKSLKEILKGNFNRNGSTTKIFPVSITKKSEFLN